MTLALLLLQISTILTLCRLLRAVLSHLGQPPVIGEIVAGLLLGPSLFGRLAPSAFAALFPAASLPVLSELSQIGLVLFMFLVGLHLDLAEVHALRKVAGLAGFLSIAVPFASGLALARPLHSLAPTAPSLPFALFFAVSMSITAFPVLARILTDQRLTATRLGHVAIACAAFNDVLAWTLLAWIVAITRSNQASLLTPIAIVAAYLATMFILIRPLLRWLTSRFSFMTELATILIFVFLSSWATEWAGLHALFGAFAAGVVWPRNRTNSDAIAAKVEPIAMVVLIPLFFSYTGLRTNLEALGGSLWLATAGIVLVAIATKVLGAFAGARVMGFDPRTALSLGALLNTRGLVELVVLNVGLDLGILSPPLFSMMVIMALVTTAITTPMLKLFLPAGHPGNGI